MPQHLFSLGEVLAMLSAVGVTPAKLAAFTEQARAVTEHRPALGASNVEVSSAFGHTSRRGYVNIRVGNVEEQMEPHKAQEIAANIHTAAEAAISDECFMKLLDELGVSDTPEERGAILLKLRELRQGSRGVVYPS